MSVVDYKRLVLDRTEPVTSVFPDTTGLSVLISAAITAVGQTKPVIRSLDTVKAAHLVSPELGVTKVSNEVVKTPKLASKILKQRVANAVAEKRLHRSLYQLF